MTIIPATNAHSDKIWENFRDVVPSGDTYVFDADVSREDALRYWLSADHDTFVVTDNDHVYGTYILRKNHPGRGSHVANASYMVSPEARGKGLGSLMCKHLSKKPGASVFPPCNSTSSSAPTPPRSPCGKSMALASWEHFLRCSAMRRKVWSTHSSCIAFCETTDRKS